jgi:hypothetical protein
MGRNSGYVCWRHDAVRLLRTSTCVHPLVCTHLRTPTCLHPLTYTHVCMVSVRTKWFLTRLRICAEAVPLLTLPGRFLCLFRPVHLPQTIHQNFFTPEFTAICSPPATGKNPRTRRSHQTTAQNLGVGPRETKSLNLKPSILHFN